MKDIITYCVGGEITGFEEAKGCYELNGMVCMQYMINVGPGIITTFEGLDEIAKQPWAVDVTQKHFVGDVVMPTGDIRHRAGEISILCKRDKETMKEIINYIQNTLRILDNNGDNQIISPFNTEILDNWYKSYEDKS